LLHIRQESSAPGSAPLPRFLAASDLHGNARRLSEMLAVADRESITHVYLVGDLYAGRGGWQVYRMLAARAQLDGPPQGVTLLWGNHELAFGHVGE
jgi:hypothetical protein